ncbi:hypothetical protein KSF78_0004587 [Schistosoma japonicum]|nr:hypothetical protein KSF78_0004587 [Schistosoma japonicum]
MLFHFNQDRLEEASTIEKTTMLAVSEYNLLIKRSEEKWTARKDLNEVENKLSLNLRDTNEKVSAQIINVKNLLFTAVETANKHRKNENNKEFHDEYNKSRRKLNRAFSNYITTFPYKCCHHLIAILFTYIH